jgi:hypothetical protein
MAGVLSSVARTWGLEVLNSSVACRLGMLIVKRELFAGTGMKHFHTPSRLLPSHI